MSKRPAIAALALACAGCAGAAPPLASAFPAAAPATETLRAGDRLAIRVLGEPELTSDHYRIADNGSVQLPLVGEVIAAGRHPSELRDAIALRLGQRYIRDPQVAVLVLARARTTFAVEGAVEAPGIFEAAAGTTLLSAIAQAKSPTRTARLDQVMVFRTVDARRMGARFDLAQIRRGAAPDPPIVAGDTVVVGHSALKAAWREFLQTAPAFSIFYYLTN